MTIKAEVNRAIQDAETKLRFCSPPISTRPKYQSYSREWEERQVKNAIYDLQLKSSMQYSTKSEIKEAIRRVEEAARQLSLAPLTHEIFHPFLNQHNKTLRMCFPGDINLQEIKRVEPLSAKAEIISVIKQAATNAGIPESDFLRFAFVESQFNHKACNKNSGAKGIFQFVPSTAKQYNILGKEFDPAANSAAAAKLWQDNKKQLERKGYTGLTSVDMYIAHQQGCGGYNSIHTAINKGHFTLDSTRKRLIENVGKDLEKYTDVKKQALDAMSDQEVAKTYRKYWEQKFEEYHE